MGRLFGTDGARGVAITELTCETAMQIGRAAALVLTKEMHHKPVILIGKDTRISSDILESALAAGICSVGADAHILGVVPTPAVSLLVKKYGADAGVMISASHNSVEFNGIKLFAATGMKLPDAVEEEIEELILDNPENITLKNGIDLGRISYEKNAVWDYVRAIMKTIPTAVNGLRVAIDCANGSASATAEKLFTGLGATCYIMSSEPDGTNINRKCGSTCLDGLSDYVKSHHCDVGVAFDGDADRCLAVDENGKVVDGDKLIAIFSKFMKEHGTLKNNAAVVTVMTNIGFTYFARENDISVETTKVGDRYVLERMLDGGFNIGGEQSGHIILLDDAVTGDGELTAAKLLYILKTTGKKMSELAACMESYPQVMINVKIKQDFKGIWAENDEIKGLVAQYTEELGDSGRILVRESGTEPLIRVMAEGKNFEQINDVCVNIAQKICDEQKKRIKEQV